MSNDLAGKSYWDSLWEGGELPSAVDPEQPGLENYPKREYHRLFRRVLGSERKPGQRLLEVGAARSAWLPYFAIQFGYGIAGLDYSEVGCRATREIARRSGVDLAMHCCDIFNPDADLIGRFDVVVSFGVVEHFANTKSCITAMARFLKPGGRMVTFIPNFAGLMGTAQRLASREVFEKHVVLNCHDLRAAHSLPDLNVEHCDYLLNFNLGVVNFGTNENRKLFSPLRRLRSWVSKGSWIIQPALPFWRPTRLLSPIVVCVAQKVHPHPLASTSH